MSARVGIFDGLENGNEDIFPYAAPQSIAAAWRTGVPKALEREFTAFVRSSTVMVA
jgi:hypothetical protein